MVFRHAPHPSEKVGNNNNNNQRVCVRNQKSLQARPKCLRAPDEEISQQYEDQSQRAIQVDLQKKSRGWLVAAGMFVLLLGFGKFGHSLMLISKKKGHLLLIAMSMKLLLQGNF